MWSQRREMDERAVAVEHRAGYGASTIMGYLLLVAIVARSWRPDLTTWNGVPLDLWLILIAGRMAHGVVIFRERTVGQRRIVLFGLAFLVAIVTAAIVQLVLSAR